MVAKKSASKKTATKKKVSKKSTVKKAVTKKKTTTKKKAASKKKASARKSAVTYINNEERYKMVAEAAYHLSEKQGFEPGRDMDNWLYAEVEIETYLNDNNIKVK